MTRTRQQVRHVFPLKPKLYSTLALAALLWGGTALATTKTEELIQSSVSRCEARLDGHLQQVASARRTANILLVTGAALAAFGSMLAGFLKKEALRKATAVLGSVGAILSVVPKTLDDPSTLRTIHANAERHRDVAVKVVRQLGFITNPEQKVLLTQYAIAQLADCDSGNPPEEVPEPPLTLEEATAMKRPLDPDARLGTR